MNLEAPTWRKTATFNPCLFTCSGGTDPAAPLPKGRDPTPPPDLSHAAWAMEGPAGLSGVQAEQGHVPWLADMLRERSTPAHSLSSEPGPAPCTDSHDWTSSQLQAGL